MKIKRIIQPGQPGTKKLVEKYGENLVCVRYRYDEQRKRKFKTIELIIENIPWQPNPAKIPMNKVMDLRINGNEVALRNRVKIVGGKWNPWRQVWHLSYKKVVELGLTDRIVN